MFCRLINSILALLMVVAPAFCICRHAPKAKAAADEESCCPCKAVPKPQPTQHEGKCAHCHISEGGYFVEKSSPPPVKELPLTDFVAAVDAAPAILESAVAPLQLARSPAMTLLNLHCAMLC